MATKLTKHTGPTPVSVCLREAAENFSAASTDSALHQVLENVAALSVRSMKRGGKVLICGNGGSAGQATHLAGELVGPFYDRKRPGYASIPLGCDVSTLTAIANDLGYETIFSRQIEAIGRKSDVLWALSTTGNSPNVVRAIKQAKSQNISTVLFTNHHGGKGAKLADLVLHTPEASTARVQELHLLYGHWLCEKIEYELMQHDKKKK